MQLNDKQNRDLLHPTDNEDEFGHIAEDISVLVQQLPSNCFGRMTQMT